MPKKAVHLFLFSAMPVWCSAQATLAGLVTDAVNGSAVPYVSVYVPELRTVTLADSAGHFRLEVAHRGLFVVQFARLGYESAFRTIAVADQALTLDIALRGTQMELREVNIVGTQVQAPRETSRKVDVVSAKEMRQSGALSVSDAVANLPGVSQLTTGAGISKPVIRGLYGNRVQVNLLGLRFDNQQWQDEHGLGIGTDGVERVEVIKGPAALQYGSDAMGGVLNIVDEKPAPIDSLQQDVRVQIFSNTRGASLGYGIRKSRAKMWWRLRAGADSHADYSSAGDERVLNSRFASYTAKGALGFQHKRWVSTNTAFGSYSLFGFVFDSLSRTVADDRMSRSFEGPHHAVVLGVFSSENTFYGDRVKWNVNAGWTTNKRQEQEGGNKISLDMLLNTASLVAQGAWRIGKASTWTNGVSAMYQTNTNLGSRVIIPDATTWEGSVFSYVDEHIGKVTVEGGVRADLRTITTERTLELNAPDDEIQPFSREWSAFNASVGCAWDPIEQLNVKANVSTGYRSANLAELSSNGLHEGTARWEIGDPDLDVERNMNAELGLTYEWHEQIELAASVYCNAFTDYIYLAPTGTEYIGFGVYRFIQTDAALQGGEVALDVHPSALKWLDATASYSHLIADKGDGSPLPFIPADRLRTALEFRPVGSIRLRVGCEHVVEQDRPAEFETRTSAYTLFNASVGYERTSNQHPLELTLVCNNLSDERYVDHLSRFKYFGLYDMGRNVSLSLKLGF
ncbi:MAG: TonB-dependent receptor [Flavobacteriales bacterium]